MIPSYASFPHLSIPLMNLESDFNGIKTDRLHLRLWENKDDIDDIHYIMCDPEVNFYLQKHKLDQRSTIESIAEKSKQTLQKKRCGYFICEDKISKSVIGMMGLNYVEIKAEHFPCYTVSWILKKDFWGKGYATEAALALMEHGFKNLKILQIYACTTWNNESSQKVMEKIGMTFVNSFEFPGFDKNDLFCKHVLYVKNG